MSQLQEQEELAEEALKLAVMVVEQTKAMEKLMRELRELIRKGGEIKSESQLKT